MSSDLRDEKAVWTRNLATRAAWLSFVGGYTQGEIAARLQVSPAKAHRLIAQAQQMGMVKVFVEGKPQDCLQLEETLKQGFGLAACTVAPDLGSGGPLFSAVAVAGAQVLHGILSGGHERLIGVGKGRTLMAMVERLPVLERPDLKIVSVSGSLTRSLSANPMDVVQGLAQRTGGEGYFLPVPYFAASLEEKQTLQAQASVQSLLALARRAEIYVIGIGSMDPNAHVRQTGMASEAEWAELQRLGSTGDLMGSFIDHEGRPVASAINDQSVGLHLEDLRGKRVIAMAGGAEKSAAIAAALRTGVVTELVLDEPAAQGIVAGGSIELVGCEARA